MVSQWRHWYWRLGHSFLRWWSRSQHNILTSSLSFMHSLVQRRRVYPHVVRWYSRDRNSPIQPQPFSLLLHMTLSDLISCSPMGKKSSRKLCSMLLRKSQWEVMSFLLIQLNPTHLFYQQSSVQFFCSLGKSWSTFCVHPDRFGSRPSHSMSLGVDCGPQEDRFDRSTCLMVSPQTCSHIRQCWKPSVAESVNQ